MHNQGDLELLTLWIVGKGGKCHKKNHHFDCSLYSIHSIDMTDLTIESNENREKRFAYLVLLLGYFRIRHFFIPRQQLHLYVSHKILLRTKLLRIQWHFRACTNWNNPEKFCYYWKSHHDYSKWLFQFQEISSPCSALSLSVLSHWEVLTYSATPLYSALYSSTQLSTGLTPTSCYCSKSILPNRFT